jgi:hypothetical protein
MLLTVESVFTMKSSQISPSIERIPRCNRVSAPRIRCGLAAAILVCCIESRARNVYITSKSSWSNPIGRNWPTPQVGDTVATSVSTAVAFDSNVRTASGNTAFIYIDEGVYLTEGIVNGDDGTPPANGFRVQTGWRVYGAGMDKDPGNPPVTTIKLLNCRPGAYGNVVIGSRQCDAISDVAIQDLKIDCNGPALATDSVNPWTLQGVQIYGVGSVTIQNVHVINAVGAGPENNENFVLCIISPSGQYSTGNLIKSCWVTDCYEPPLVQAPFCKGRISAISLNRFGLGSGTIQGLVEDCHVELPGKEEGAGHPFSGSEFAYNAHNTVDSAPPFQPRIR